MMMELSALTQRVKKQNKSCFHMMLVNCSQSVLFFFFQGHTDGIWKFPQAKGQIVAIASSLHHSHSQAGSQLCLRPTPQLTATPDPQPTEQRGQGSNLHPHGYQSDSFLLSHNWKSQSTCSSVLFRTNNLAFFLFFSYSEIYHHTK